MSLISSVSLFVWEFVKRHPGIVLVLVGVAGEITLEWKSAKGKLAWLKKSFWVLLVLGLAIEFGEAAKSDKDVAIISKQSGDAIERAGKANQFAAESNERSKQLEATNLVLRSNLTALEMKVASRRLTGEQKSKLSKLLSDILSEIGIISYGSDPESADFADDFAEAIGHAKWYALRIRNFTGGMKPPRYGILVGTLDGVDLPESTRLCDALTSLELPYEKTVFDEKDRQTMSPYFQTNALYLLIAHKPPPNFNIPPKR